MNMNKFFAATAVLTVVILFGCKSTKTGTTASTPESTLLKVGDKAVTTSEFLYVYNKNNAKEDSAFTEQSLKEYLELYKNFKLKVLEAEALGYDTAASFNKELDGYKKQLAQPYLKEKGVTEKLIKEAYDRMSEEINASHLLINLAEDAEPVDTLKAYTKIMDLRSRILKGEDFGAVAKANSQDPSAKSNLGNLGYFTSLQMVYPFEDAAFKTKVGEVSYPVRTKFGYHLIKVHNKRPSQGQVRAAHIMVRSTEGEAVEDSLAAVKKASEIYDKLQKGETWESLCSQFSDDQRSKSNGGELPWFGTGNMIPTFEDAAFNIKKVGDHSKPTQTPYGWHIIKLLERKGLEPFASLEPTLKTKVSKDSRSDLNKAFFLKRLKKENNLVENAKNKAIMISKADSNLTKGQWTYNETAADNKLELFSINGEKYLMGDFLKFVKERQKPKANHTAGFLIQQLYNEYVDKILVENEEKNLPNKYPDYKNLVKEYRDGILLFQLMDEKVWTKAVQDTAGLKGYFGSNREQYRWNERADAVVYNCANKEILEKLKGYLNKNLYPVNEPKPEAISFLKNIDTLDSKGKSTLDLIVNTMVRDKHIYADIQVGGVKGEKKGIGSKRLKTIKTYLIKKGIDSTKFNLNDNGFVLTNFPAVGGVKLYSNSKKSLEKNLNEGKALNLQVTEVKFQKGENQFVDKTDWKSGTYSIEENGRIVYVIVNAIEQPRQKTFEESRGMVISDYQNFLEKQWLEQLRKKYPIVINNEELKKLVKK